MADSVPNNVMESQILSFAQSATQQIVANLTTDQSKAHIQDRVAYFAKMAIDKVAKGESFDQIKQDLVKQVQQEVNAFIQTEGVQFVGNLLGQKTGSPLVGAMLAQGLASQLTNVQQASQSQPKPNIPPAGAWIPPDQEQKSQTTQQQNQQTQQQTAVDPSMQILGTLVQQFLGAKNPNAGAVASNSQQAGGIDPNAMANASVAQLDRATAF